MILEVKEIHTFYGTSHILFGISLEIAEGETVCLLGRNGAGKTTTLKSIIGLTPPRSGGIEFMGVEITCKETSEIARMGIGFVPEEKRIFTDLTVRENLQVPAKRSGGWWTMDDAYDLFPVLRERAKCFGGALSGGERQMLTIARTLMLSPRLLLVDEPAEGLSPIVVNDLSQRMSKLKEKGVAMLLSEQGIKFAPALSQRAYILEKGMISYQGSVTELLEDNEIKKKYLTF